MRRTAQTIGTLLAGVALAFASVLATVWNLGSTQSDWGLPRLVPDDPDVTLFRTITRFRTSARAPSGSDLSSAMAAAGLDPLEDEPLLLASLANTGSGHDKAIALLSEARRRNPAASEVRILLLDRYLRTNDMAGAIGEIGALSALLPDDGREDLMQLLLNLVAAPETRHAAIAALGKSPLRKALIGDLARAGASPYLLLSLSDGLEGFEAGSDDAKWSQSVTQALVQQGDLEGAYRLWRHFFALPAGEQGVFDGSFKGLAAPPFAWQLSSGTGAFAELQEGGLRIRYEGRDSAIFARQLLLLRPGRYRLVYGLAKDDDPPPNLAWRIDCLNSGRTMLDLSFVQTYSFEGSQSPDFTIPGEDCPGQWLVLSGRPSPGPSMRTALITKVETTPVAEE